jgi:very-short-patch-repair endonuclease
MSGLTALLRPNLSAMSTPLLPRDRARRLRRDQTDAERRLWMVLRRHQLGVQVRVLRFSDREALMEPEAVLSEIQNRL